MLVRSIILTDADRLGIGQRGLFNQAVGTHWPLSCLSSIIEAFLL